MTSDSDIYTRQEIAEATRDHVRTIHAIRRDALIAAVSADMSLTHFSPVPLSRSAACTHENWHDCECRYSENEQEAYLRLVEEAIADRIMRNTVRFEGWLRGGVTPEQMRDAGLRAIADNDEIMLSAMRGEVPAEPDDDGHQDDDDAA